MQPIIWAFGAMLVLTGIIAFLPIGFTFKGKFIVVLAGFVLALGGLAAVASFPLWQAALMLLLLTLVTAYIMESRLAGVLYNQVEDISEEEIDDKPESIFLNKQTDKTTELDLLDLAEIDTKTVNTTLDNIEELDDSLELQPQMAIVKEQSFEIENEDLPEMTEIKDDAEIEAGYLSDIESLLLEESEEKTDLEEEGWLEDLDDLPPVNVDEPKVSKEDEDNELEELFFAWEEAAVSHEEENGKLKKTVELQKN